MSDAYSVDSLPDGRSILRHACQGVARRSLFRHVGIWYIQENGEEIPITECPWCHKELLKPLP